MGSRGRVAAMSVGIVFTVVAMTAAAIAGEGQDSSGEGLAVAAPARPLAAVPIEQVQHWVSVAGTDFQSDHTNLTHVQSTGCVYTEQADNLTTAVLVPDGAVLDSMEMEYIDSSATGSGTLWITSYDGTTLTDIAQVATAGSVGRGTVVIDFSHTVASDTEAISFNWRPNVFGSAIQLCQVRLSYTLPAFTLYGDNAAMLVEAGNATREARTLARLRNNGRVRLEMFDDSTLNEWQLSAGNGAFDIFSRDGLGRLRLLDNGTLLVGIAGNTRMKLDRSGNLRIDGTLTQSSDAAGKHGFAPVDAEAILDALLELDISTWSYTDDSGNIVHLGPTAQDFYAAFGLGADDTGIAAVDADGIALVSIQALADLLAGQDARIAGLEQRLAAIEAVLADLVADGD